MPGTHVLAIGVGNYPHLIDGTGPLAKNPLGLAQLSSPPVSTQAFIDWCLAPLLQESSLGFQNPNCPIASVEAVISSAKPMSVSGITGPIPVDSATKVNIENAFAQWLARVASNDNNIGVLYFCGHGVMVADHYLLSEDFGSNSLQPWDKAFDLSNTLRAVEREVRGALYFFIDACREVSRDMALTLGGCPLALMAADLKKPVIRSASSLVHATGEGKLAFALEGKVSRFSEALLKALSGYCGIRGAGSKTWDVDGETVAYAVRKLLENGNKTANRRQVSDQTISGGSIPLLRSSVPPKVIVRLDLLPEPMRAVARMYLKSAKGAPYEDTGTSGPYITEVSRGFYDVGANPTGAQFGALVFEDQDIFPPTYDLIMQAT
jgi:hypothetical protein